MNTELARFNMIEQQIRTWEVLDLRVLEAIGRLQREQFVLPAQRALAFADLSLPFGDVVAHPEQRMLEPKVEGRLAQSLQCESTHHLLVVGAGSGYFCALLGLLCKSVLAYEIDARVAEMARKNLAQANINNVTIKTGDGLVPDTSATFERIVLTGAVDAPPKALFRQLSLGGFIIAPLIQNLITPVARFNDKGEKMETLFDTSVPPLLFTKVKKFIF